MPVPTPPRSNDANRDLVQPRNLKPPTFHLSSTTLLVHQLKKAPSFSCTTLHLFLLSLLESFATITLALVLVTFYVVLPSSFHQLESLLHSGYLLSLIWSTFLPPLNSTNTRRFSTYFLNSIKVKATGGPLFNSFFEQSDPGSFDDAIPYPQAHARSRDIRRSNRCGLTF